jgi:hypothetical protein
MRPADSWNLLDVLKDSRIRRRRRSRRASGRGGGDQHCSSRRAEAPAVYARATPHRAVR